MQKLKIGYFEHWHRPPYVFADFLKKLGVEFEKIDFTQKGYLEKFDVAIVEQHGGSCRAFNTPTGVQFQVILP